MSEDAVSQNAISKDAVRKDVWSQGASERVGSSGTALARWAEAGPRRGGTSVFDETALRRISRDEALLYKARVEGGIPSILLRPERRPKQDGPLDATLGWVQSQIVPRLADRRRRKLARILPLVAADTALCEAASDSALEHMLAEQAHQLRRATTFDMEVVAKTFAVVREMSGRVLGQRHYDVQLLGAYTMLNGMLAEMATGEGKTLTATLAAGTAALSGLPVHVITVNDYLATRDADHLRPLYARMGLSVGTVIAGQSTEERQRNYACDVVYCTNKEIAFDYLRDRIGLGEHHDNLRLKLEQLHSRVPRAKAMRLRGLHFALVDEADSVLVDEARTPLIISAPAKSDVYAYTAAEAVVLAADLKSPDHYSLLEEQQRVVMTRAGQKAVERLSKPLSAPWRNAIMRDELASQALAALHLFKRDEHYLVQDDKIQIVDEYTGRVMPDRMWSSGLHQMIEAKEHCAVSVNRDTIARITYQKLFRRYAILSGMSGTLRPIAKELWRVYRLPIGAIPTHRPLKRIMLPDLVFATEAEKWVAIIARVRAIAATGAPVLVGTRSVAASELLSEMFDAEGMAHFVLNASQDKEEAAIVAEAGQPGRITIATNMAGRGTDIKIAPEGLAAGGLHVIMSERHDARRIDDQLAGRAARQGEPGCFQAFLSLEDPLMTAQRETMVDRIAKRFILRREDGAARLLARQQRRIERIHLRMRADLLRSDQSQRQLNAFSGQDE